MDTKRIVRDSWLNSRDWKLLMRLKRFIQTDLPLNIHRKKNGYYKIRLGDIIT